MSTHRDPSKTCTATNRRGESCQAWRVAGKDKCYHHLGTSKDGSSHESNQNATTHGAYADQHALYAKAFDDRERDLADWIFQDYYELYQAKHGVEPPAGYKKRLFEIAVNAVTEMRVADWYNSKPDTLDTGTPYINRETHISEGGQRYYRYKNAPSIAAIKHLEGYNRKWLKDLGLFPDDAALSGEASKDLAVWIAEKLAGG